MNKQKDYSPIQCTMKSCAFPWSICRECLCNKTSLGKRAVTLKDPKLNYKFCHEIMRPKSAAHEK